MMSRSERPLSKSTPGFTPAPDAVANLTGFLATFGFANASFNASSPPLDSGTLSSKARYLGVIQE